MVEAMYEQSFEYSNQIRKSFKFFVLDKKPDVSKLPGNTNCAFPVQFYSQSLENGQPLFHVLIEVTKDCIDAINKTTSSYFIVLCLLS